MPLPIDKGKWTNYIVDLESKLKDRFKVLKNEENISEKKIDSICPVGTTPEFSAVVLTYIKQSLTTLQNFDLFYQQ